MVRAVTATTKAVAANAAAGYSQARLQPAAAVGALPADSDRTEPVLQPMHTVEQPVQAAAAVTPAAAPAAAAAVAAAPQPPAAAAGELPTAASAQQQMRLGTALADKQAEWVAADVQQGPVKCGVHAVQGLIGQAATLLSKAHSNKQQQRGRRTVFKGSSGGLLYSLWSPSDAGLQEMTAAATGRGGALCDDAGWGCPEHLTAVSGSKEGDW